MLKAGKIEFSGADGQILAARIDVPARSPRGWAIFAHCFSCSKDIRAAGRIAARLNAHNIGVLRFDFTGLGHSEGDFANTNFSTNVQDLLSAAQWLDEQVGGPQLIIGHSLGGAAVIVAAGQIDTVRAVATIGAPADADHVIHNFGASLDAIESDGEAVVQLAGRDFTIKQQFVEDVRGAKVRDAAAALHRPLLVMHSPIDETVGIDNATGLFVAAMHPKSFVSLDTADHLLSTVADADYAGDTIAVWAVRYIGESIAGEPIEPDAAPIIATESGRSPFEIDLTIGRHTIIADEPSHVGGRDAGPDPYALVTAGLGACTAMTLRMYADRKNWPLERVSVALSHEKTHAEDCAHCEKGRKVDVFDRTITLEGEELTLEQREKLLEIADKCPVHKTLEEAGCVRTRLV